MHRLLYDFLYFFLLSVFLVVVKLWYMYMAVLLQSMRPGPAPETTVSSDTSRRRNTLGDPRHPKFSKRSLIFVPEGVVSSRTASFDGRLQLRCHTRSDEPGWGSILSIVDLAPSLRTLQWVDNSRS